MESIGADLESFGTVIYDLESFGTASWNVIKLIWKVLVLGVGKYWNRSGKFWYRDIRPGKCWYYDYLEVILRRCHVTLEVLVPLRFDSTDNFSKLQKYLAIICHTLKSAKIIIQVIRIY